MDRMIDAGGYGICLFSANTLQEFLKREKIRKKKVLSLSLIHISCSLVYKGRKVALYGGAYAPSYLPNDVDTFACGVNCGNH